MFVSSCVDDDNFVAGCLLTDDIDHYNFVAGCLLGGAVEAGLQILDLPVEVDASHLREPVVVVTGTYVRYNKYTFIKHTLEGVGLHACFV